MVIDRLAESHGILVSRKESFSKVGLGTVSARKIALAKPQTFMNLSGPAVKGLLERYGLEPGRVVMVYDELDIPWGELRIRPKGSAAGHNGMKSVIGSLGTSVIPRVRLGIHPGHPIGDGANFVLAPFRRAQKQEVEETVARGAAAVESIIAVGVEKSMTIYNRRAEGLNPEEE
jgi:PTH1 family peptidyl-tRNA hydrolase